MGWLDIDNNDDQAYFSSVSFWENLKSEHDGGRFWADRIKDFYGQPAKRLSIAMDYLPLPGAFKQAATALRAIIREKRKLKEGYSDELELLYLLAAVYSFAVPYSSYLEQPGFNVLESVPGSVVKNLKFSYSELGYEKLELLNKTDAKRCVEAWGKPLFHATLNEMHNDIWHRYEKALPAKQEKNLESLLAKAGL